MNEQPQFFCNKLRNFRQNSVLQSFEDYKLGIRQATVDQFAHSRSAAGRELARHNQRRHINLRQPRLNFRFGVDIEVIQERICIDLDDLFQPLFENVGIRCREVGRIPGLHHAPQRRFDTILSNQFGEALGFHFFPVGPSRGR